MEISEHILSWIIDQNKTYNYMNKRFQDTLMNYYLENYIASLLIDDCLNSTIYDIHLSLKSLLSPTIFPKYMGMLNIYTDALKRRDLFHQYQHRLCEIIFEDPLFHSPHYNSFMWKKVVSYLLLQHSININITNFNHMWQCAFPDNPLKIIKFPKHTKNNTTYYNKRMLALQNQQQKTDNLQHQNHKDCVVNMLLSYSSKLNNHLKQPLTLSPTDMYPNTAAVTTPLQQPSHTTQSDQTSPQQSLQIDRHSYNNNNQQFPQQQLHFDGDNFKDEVEEDEKKKRNDDFYVDSMYIPFQQNQQQQQQQQFNTDLNKQFNEDQSDINPNLNTLFHYKYLQ